jgi:hypothetical protein
MVIGQETPETTGRGGFQARPDHHECVSAPSEITQVWFYIYPMPPKTTEKQLLILEFHMPSSRWRYAEGAMTSRRPIQQYAWRHWRSPTTLTQQRKSILHICCIWYFYTTPDTTARSLDSTGQILLVSFQLASGTSIYWGYFTVSSQEVSTMALAISLRNRLHLW